MSRITIFVLTTSILITLSISIIETTFIITQAVLTPYEILVYFVTCYGILWLQSLLISFILSPILYLKEFVLKKRSYKTIVYLFTAILTFVFAVSYYINGTVYRRLYEPYHLALSLVSMVSIAVTFYIFLKESKNRRIVAIGVILSMFSLLLSLYSIRANETVRELSYRRSIVLSQSILKFLGRRKPKIYLKDIKNECRCSTKKGEFFGRFKGYNLLFLTIDALRPDILFKSSHYSIMPNLERVAKVGIYYPKAYTPSAGTVLSIYSIFTGKVPSELRFSKVVFTLDDRIIPVLKTLGWKKTHALPINDPSPTFVKYLKENGYKTVSCASVPFFRRDGGITKDFEIVDNQVYLKRNYNITGIVADMLAGCIIYWWNKIKDKPIFFWSHFPDPHAPYWAHKGITKPEDSDYLRYLGELKFSDNYLGVTLSKLKGTPKWNKLLLIITSDHGEEFWDHGAMFHASSLYEEIVNVPLIIAGADIKPMVIKERVSLVDLPTTILYLLGIEDGASFSKCIIPPFSTGCRRNLIYSYFLDIHYNRRWEMIIWKDWKIIHEIRDDTWELYNLKEDPHEKRNLFDEKGEELLKRMMRN